VSFAVSTVCNVHIATSLLPTFLSKYGLSLATARQGQLLNALGPSLWRHISVTMRVPFVVPSLAHRAQALAHGCQRVNYIELADPLEHVTRPVVPPQHILDRLHEDPFPVDQVETVA
jgi:hypothetical protein